MTGATVLFTVFFLPFTFVDVDGFSYTSLVSSLSHLT